MNELSITNIDTYMVDNLITTEREKDKVCWLEIVKINLAAYIILVTGNTGDNYAILGKYVLHKTGTIKPCGAGTSPNVFHAYILSSRIHDCRSFVIF